MYDLELWEIAELIAALFCILEEVSVPAIPTTSEPLPLPLTVPLA
jgi:hypothetical protein